MDAIGTKRKTLIIFQIVSIQLHFAYFLKMVSPKRHHLHVFYVIKSSWSENHAFQSCCTGVESKWCPNTTHILKNAFNIMQKKKETTTYLYLIKNFMFLKAEQILQYMYMYILCKMLANRLFFCIIHFT